MRGGSLVSIKGPGPVGVLCVSVSGRFWITLEEFAMVQFATPASAPCPFSAFIIGVVLFREAHAANSVFVEGCPYFFVGHLFPFIALPSRMGLLNCF